MVMFVNSFTVPAGREEEFVARWTEVNRYMAAKPGYLEHALHRSVDPAAPYRFVNLARWESAEAWRAAHDAGFRAMVTAPEWREFTSTPCLYEDAAVHTGRADTAAVGSGR
jgi:heme-degrading monooxygenase HmoA